MMYDFSSINKQRCFLFGIATLWIACFHSWDVNFDAIRALSFLNIGNLLQCIRLIGNCGVDIFLFLSGAGLYFSFSKNPGLSFFYRRRFIRVVPCSFLVIMVVSLISRIDNIWYFLARIFFLDYFFIKGISQTFWYISAILFLYLIFPLFYRIIRKLGIWGALIIIASSLIVSIFIYMLDYDYFYQLEMLLTRIPVFVTGIVMASLMKDKKTISNVKALIICLLGIIYLYVMFLIMNLLSDDMIFIKHYLYLPLAVFLVISFSFILEHVNIPFLVKPIEFIGSYSLEIYLIHQSLYNFVHGRISFFENHQILYALSVLAVSVLLAVILKKAVNLTTCLFEKKISPK